MRLTAEMLMLKPMEMKMNLAETIRYGDRVTIVNRFGQTSTGKAVLHGPAGWVLNMGGKHGTPAIAGAENVVSVKPAKKGRFAGTFGPFGRAR